MVARAGSLQEACQCARRGCSARAAISSGVSSLRLDAMAVRVLSAALLLAGAAALAPSQTSRRGLMQQASHYAAAAAATIALPAFAEDEVLDIKPATTKMGGLLEKFADVNRGFRIMKPSTWNQFEGEAGAYDFRWVDVVSPVDAISVTTSSYGGAPTIQGLADVAKLGAKLSGSRGAIVASRARTSDGIVFYDYEFVSDDKMHELLSLCVHKGRLWQVSAKSPDRTWPKTSPLYRNAVGSFVPKL